MKFLAAVCFAGSIFFLGSAVAHKSAAQRTPERTTISAMLTNPKQFDGKFVVIRGPAVGLFEVSYICDEIDDAFPDSKDCLWIDRGDFALSDYHQKVIDLVGVFDSHSFGHRGAYGGAISAKSLFVLGAHSNGEPPPHEPTRQ
jgi:hypothetical protein